MTIACLRLFTLPPFPSLPLFAVPLLYFRRAPLNTVHLASHFLAGAPRSIFVSLLTKAPVKVIQRPPRSFPLLSASRTATLTSRCYCKIALAAAVSPFISLQF
jgi:hypothetical protein